MGHVIIAWSLMAPNGSPTRFILIDEFLITGSEPIARNKLTYRIVPYPTRDKANSAAVAVTQTLEWNRCVMTEEPRHWWFTTRTEGLRDWLRDRNQEDFDAMFANTMKLGRTLDQSVA